MRKLLIYINSVESSGNSIDSDVDDILTNDQRKIVTIFQQMSNLNYLKFRTRSKNYQIQFQIYSECIPLMKNLCKIEFDEVIGEQNFFQKISEAYNKEYKLLINAISKN